jgi:hypothetical protein
MGVVQLMAPPGNNADGTNTVLDDGIRTFMRNVSGGAFVEQVGTRKINFLGWRGFPNELGAFVDDAGAATLGGNPDNQGDIRPSPILLPVPFGSKTRLRSGWIDTGSSSRRPVGAGGDGQPRGLDTTTGLTGPRYEFAAIDPATGYCVTEIQSSSARVVYPTVVPLTPLASPPENDTTQGIYRVTLATPALGTVDDRYSQYECELLSANGLVMGSFRILSHTNQVLRLSPESGPLPATAVQARVRSKFFRFVTNGQDGLGGSYIGSAGGRVPNANARIGFAFHQDPSDSAAQRYPSTPGTFTYDLANPQVQEDIRALHAQFVQWDVIFDTTYKTIPADQPTPLGPSTGRPELHFLRLPFRF